MPSRKELAANVLYGRTGHSICDYFYTILSAALELIFHYLTIVRRHRVRVAWYTEISQKYDLPWRPTSGPTISLGVAAVNQAWECYHDSLSRHSFRLQLRVATRFGCLRTIEYE